ncbi:beta-lactamase family protein [Fluoribacter gormanii]|uniref:hypothetical protein n=1 Tax=Fluoribacter gormanii TaxID=464 RepID=UPI0022445CF1|nr:hypothetical protein [Fluoribacter gormanii]MCW8444749.1 beta-lactamase family protein [Fluoribacter gormanii]
MTYSKTDKYQITEQSVVENVRGIAKIAQVGVATVNSSDAPIVQNFGDNESMSFGAASLSKPVFAYLVLKLVEAGTLTLDMRGLNDILSFKDFCDQHGFKWKNDINEEDIARINAFTPAMILSHKTGFDLNNWSNEVNHQFEPGQEYYRYSGLPLFYLQKVIEKLHEPQLVLMPDHTVSLEQNKLYVSIMPPNLRYTIIDSNGLDVSGIMDLKTLNCELQTLTDIHELYPYQPKIIEEIARRGHTANLEILAKNYVFKPLNMNQSSFGGTPCAANSLSTTAEDYARFVQAWMCDEKLQYAFKPQIRMTQDPWAKETVSDAKALNYVAECLGFQLEIDDQGKPLTAFKTGDMGPWRGWVAINLSDNLNERRATVYFAKGPEPDGNGHILAETLIKPYFKLEHGLKWFKEKYGFATGLEEDWGALQKERCNRGMLYQKQSPKLPKPGEEIAESLDSTQKMFQQLNIHHLSPRAELKPSKSQEQEPGSKQPLHETEGILVEETQEDHIFNPTPFPRSYDP